MEADVLLGSEVLVEARPLEDDPDLASYHARLANDIAPVDGRASTGRGKGRREDRDHGCLPRPVRPEQDEELAGLDLERDAVDGVLLGLLVALDEIFDADHGLSI